MARTAATGPTGSKSTGCFWPHLEASGENVAKKAELGRRGRPGPLVCLALPAATGEPALLAVARLCFEHGQPQELSSLAVDELMLRLLLPGLRRLAAAVPVVPSSCCHAPSRFPMQP